MRFASCSRAFSSVNAEATRSNAAAAQVHALLSDLQSCGTAIDLRWGRGLHARAVQAGNESDISVGSALIKMYAKCGSMASARRVFDCLQRPHLVSWNTLLLGYAVNGQGYAALELFSEMKSRGCAPNCVTYLAVLKACTSLVRNGASKADGLEIGRRIHLEIGRHSDLYVLNALVEMYAACGSMAEARRVFDSIQNPSIVSWTCLLLGYADNGEGHVSLQLFSKLKTDGCVPNSVTYVAVLKACTSLAVNGDARDKEHVLTTGRNLHSEIGLHLNLYVQSMLIDMYAACGSMFEARRVFDSTRNPDVVCWTAVLSGYAGNGEGHAALDLFSQMKTRRCAPNSVTYVAVLRACASIGALASGRKFHSEMTEFTPLTVTCLVDFYAKCGSMLEARAVFDLHLRSREQSTWNALLAGYSACGDTTSVFDSFEAMLDEGFRPNGITFLSVLLCCSHAGLVEKARHYIGAMPLFGETATVMHYTCLVDTLGRANQLNEAIAVLRRMPCCVDRVIWMILLCACRKWKNVAVGRWAFESLTDIDKPNSAGYVLMGHIYGSRGMCEEQERVLESRIKFCNPNVHGQANVEDAVGNVVKFVLGEEDLPEVQAILEQLVQG